MKDNRLLRYVGLALGLLVLGHRGKLRKLARSMDDAPEDIADLEDALADTYFCNFSLFQSIPDSWAIKQLFPVMPIHRLNEAPSREAVLGDITCDSDGKLDQFIDRRDVRRTLSLHHFNGEPYYIGVFLVGAYQEILGDLHNLFGDTRFRVIGAHALSLTFVIIKIFVVGLFVFLVIQVFIFVLHFIIEFIL